MRFPIHIRPNFLLAMIAVLNPGCGEVTPPVLTGTLIAVVKTFGGDPDSSYELVVGKQAKYLFGDGSVAFTVEGGPHTVSINNVADNCTVADSESASVEVPRGKSAKVVFTVNCDATGLEISTQTAGADVPNNYQLKVDGMQIPVAVTGKVRVTRLVAGAHTVEITIPAENCTVSGPTRLAVRVEPRRVTPVLFTVECAVPVRLKKIAFHSLSADPEKSPNEILVANPDGSGATRLASGQNASWSPDGKRIAFAATSCDWYYGCSSSLGIIDPETTRSFSHLFSNHRVETPAWAPDGQVIAYTEFVNEALYVVSPSGGQPSHVPIPGAMRVREPAWSPDSRKIALACLVSSGNYDICVINRAGSELFRLVQRNSIDRQPAWSPDGNLIAFTIAPTTDATGEIAVVPAGGGDVTIVTHGTEPSWSRDGTRLMFSRTDGLYAINLDGTGLTRLTTGKHRAPAMRP